MKQLLLALITLVFVTPALAQDDSETASQEAEQIVERAENTVSILQPLLDLERELERRIEDLTAQGDGIDPEEIALVQTELDNARDQISLVVAGVSERDYRTLDEGEFDLNAEVQNLLEPFVLVLNEATSDARQLERTRRALDVAVRRLDNATIATENIRAALEQTSDPAITERLESDLLIWEERLTLQDTNVEALNQQISDLQSARTTVGRNVNSAFQVFFRDRGISLVMGIGALIGVLILARILAFAGTRAMGWRGKPKTFAMRLAGVLLPVVAVVIGILAMMVIFNMRNDWLLLGLTIILLLGLLWFALKMLPSLIDQLSVLLNLGAVQENERVLFNGVPFTVHKLSFFTDLVNPALDGGEFTLPVRELVGMHSRPAAEDEAWFPSMKGDWVRLSDGNSGQVVAQTPEMVVIEALGGSRITYQTGDYLAATPENLSHGFRSEITFGIGYQHQSEATTTIIDQMNAGVRAHFEALLDPGQIRDVDIEFLAAGASSLDFEVEIDVDGSAAHRFEEIERELARCMVNLANRHGWEIPFQQVVVHRA